MSPEWRYQLRGLALPSSTTRQLLPESAKSKELSSELFSQPAARIRVSTRDDRSKEARPWEPEHSGPVLLWAGATVLKLDSDGTSLVSAGNYDAMAFLREVIEDERQWYPRQEGFKYAGWALPGDVANMKEQRASIRRAFIDARAREAAERRSAVQIESAVPNAPNPQAIAEDKPVEASSIEDTHSLIDQMRTKHAAVEPLQVRPPETVVKPEGFGPLTLMQRIRRWIKAKAK